MPSTGLERSVLDPLAPAEQPASYKAQIRSREVELSAPIDRSPSIVVYWPERAEKWIT